MSIIEENSLERHTVAELKKLVTALDGDISKVILENHCESPLGGGGDGVCQEGPRGTSATNTTEKLLQQEKIERERKDSEMETVIRTKDAELTKLSALINTYAEQEKSTRDLEAQLGDKNNEVSKLTSIVSTFEAEARLDQSILQQRTEDLARKDEELVSLLERISALEEKGAGGEKCASNFSTPANPHLGLQDPNGQISLECGMTSLLFDRNL
eukprot:gene5998-2513_t